MHAMTSVVLKFSYGRKIHSLVGRFYLLELIHALKLGFNVLSLAPLLSLLLPPKPTFDNFSFVQSKAFVTQVMHAKISYLHIVFLLFLLPNL